MILLAVIFVSLITWNYFHFKYLFKIEKNLGKVLGEVYFKVNQIIADQAGIQVGVRNILRQLDEVKELIKVSDSEKNLNGLRLATLHERFDNLNASIDDLKNKILLHKKVRTEETVKERWDNMRGAFSITGNSEKNVG